MIERFREAAVKSALTPNSASTSFPFWNREIKHITNGVLNGRKIFDLGDHLKQIFSSSTGDQIRESSKSNSSVSTGGAAWESLVCWYLNLCLVGTNVVVVKSKKDLLPKFVTDAITVKYNNFKSNTEADLIFIAFPALTDWPTIEKGETFSKYFDRLHNLKFSLKDISIGVIQTKTNWNDNAQIPMLWDMVYSANGFGRNVTVGSNGVSISSFKSFTYSFITVPSQKDINKMFKNTSVAVHRVRNISGGNYWGLPTKDGVCDSIKEFFGRNLIDFIPASDHIVHLDNEVKELTGKYSYFGLDNFGPSYLP